MPKIKRKHVILLVGLIILLYFVTVIAPKLVSTVTPTTTIKYGQLKVEDEVTCYILRDETVYGAKTDGSVNYIAEEYDLEKVGSKILEFSPKSSSEDKEAYSDSITEELGDAMVKTDSNTALRKGIFSTYIDGFENYFTYDNYEKITELDAESKKINIKDFKNTSVEENEPMYKITDQSVWYMICWVDSKNIGKFQKGNSVTAVFDDGTEIKFKIKDIQAEEENWKLLLQTNRYYADFIKYRKVSVNLISLDKSGIIVPNKAITTLDGEIGVYVVSKTGNYNFVRIKSLGSDGTNTVVSENYFYDDEGNSVTTVKVFDEILKNPIEK